MLSLRFLAAAALWLAPASYAQSQLHETASAPPNWHLVGQAHQAAYVRLSVALAQPGLSELRKRLSDISDRNSPDYGAHLSKAQIRDYRRPDGDALEAIYRWLTQRGAEDVQVDSTYIHFNATVATANSLLECNFSEYQSPQGNRVYRATEYSLPSELAPHVRFVYPVTQFIETHGKRRASAEPEQDHRVSRRQSSIPQSCNTYVTPDCLVDLYNINYTAPDSLSGSKLAIAGFLEQYPNQASLHEFLTSYSPQRNDSGYSADYNFTVVSLNGGNATDSGSGPEALLDTFYSMAFTQPLPASYLSTGGRGQYLGEDGSDMSNSTANKNEPYLEFLEGLLAMDDGVLPEVLSISYTDDEQSTPRAYALHVCDLFMQLAARGVSVLAASGDGGAYGIDHSDCIANSGPGKGGKRFLAGFPATCPYVTAVGATGLYTPWEPASWSGGGFSEYFEAPDWQRDAAAAYVGALNGSHDGWYNATGRGYPDVTLVGVRYLLGGSFTSKGTSASTPVWAAMVALINDARRRAGKPALGFLNPLLYSEQVRVALRDVTSGNIGGCIADNGDVELGFSSAVGWDPASGLGTPDFGALLEILT